MGYMTVDKENLICVPRGVCVVYDGRVLNVADVSETGADLRHGTLAHKYLLADELEENPIRIIGDERVVRENVALLEGQTRMLGRDRKALRGGNRMEFLADEEGYMFPSTNSTESNYNIRANLAFIVAGGGAGTSPIAFASPEMIDDVPDAISAVACEVPGDGDFPQTAVQNIGASAYRFNLMLKEEFYSRKAESEARSAAPKGWLHWLTG